MDFESDVNKGLSRYAATLFAERWKSATSENQDAESFWREFFIDVCQIKDIRAVGIEFQRPVINSSSGNPNYLDVFWKDTLLIEHKSAGKNLDTAETQARNYLVSLPPALRPPYVIVSDFARIRIVDVLLNRNYEFLLSNLSENLSRIESVIAGHTVEAVQVEIDVDQKAAKLMANLYQVLEDHGYSGHETSIFLIRILFLLFGDDSGMWQKHLFHNLLLDSAKDGHDLGPQMSSLFEVLDSSLSDRPTSLPENLSLFPYVNGGIFTEKISTFHFTTEMRLALVEAAQYDWRPINPTIFGSLFQLIKSKEERHKLGEHYTSEENILKIVGPLFMDELQESLVKCWDNKGRLKNLRKSLSKYNFLDPACGCGNFLVVSYKSLRQFELEIIQRLLVLEGKESDLGLDGTMGLSVSLDQLYGIEIEEWPSQVAKVALFISDHQENLKLETVTGEVPNRFPLSRAAKIVQANALSIPWTEVCDITSETVILGNPPFLGSLLLSEEQKIDQDKIWEGHPKSGVMDYVTNWYLIASRFITETGAKVAFVSTNSITQGEQPAILWAKLEKCDVGIFFAHRTFSWENDAPGKAAVHCVIIGLTSRALIPKTRRLWSYETVHSLPIEAKVSEINAYLVAAPEVIIGTRQGPMNKQMPPMFYGNMPRDGGFLSKISPSEAKEIRESDVIAGKYLRRLIGATEVINDKERYCLWLISATPKEIASSPILRKRVKLVKQFRIESSAASTRAMAATSHLFAQIAQPKANYIAVPRHSSESRKYVPMAYVKPDVIASDALMTIPNAGLEIFAVVMSSAFNLWNSAVSGRIKNDYRISQEITYNNFPIPELNNAQISALQKAGQEILDARMSHRGSSLADLYNPTAMPQNLIKVHRKNDLEIYKILGIRNTAKDEVALGRLFELYEELSTSSELKLR